MSAEKYQNQFRIPSARLPGWEYGGNAAYFVTICTKNKMYAFGKVIHGQVVLSLLGAAAADCWRRIPEHFPFIRLGEYVVMPNHIHGIVVIEKSIICIPQSIHDSKNAFGPQAKNLASIVRGFKVGVTKQARLWKISFGWQPRYHDHIIRTEAEYVRIRQYILENPQKWSDDCYF